MREKNKIKIVLSLLIAVAFLLPVSSVMGYSTPSIEKAKASAIGPYGEPERMGVESSGIITLDDHDNGCFPIDVVDISLNGEIIETGDIFATGTYTLDDVKCMTEWDPCMGQWSSVVHDLNQEGWGENAVPPVRNAPLTPMDVSGRCTADFVYLNFTMSGRNQWQDFEPLGLVQIYTLVDGTTMRLFTSPIDSAVLYEGATPIPGAVVTRTGGWPDDINASKIVVKIPRAYWVDCCSDLEWWWVIYSELVPENWNQGDGNMGRGGWLPDICIGDFYPATIKNFINVTKLVEHPGTYTDDVTTEIYREDFEDPCEIEENWLTIDCPIWGDIDGWTWSDKRYCSEGHSMHVSSYDEYLPNQHDILELGFGGTGLDVSDYDEIEICWCQFVEGDYINIGNVSVPILVLQDYGWFEYAFSATGPWIQQGDMYYDSEGVTEDICETIELNHSQLDNETMFFRWVWISDPAFCYEGWYIDDVVITGTVYGETITEPWDEWVFIHDSWIGPVVQYDECKTYVFPDKVTFAEEGTYRICAWIEALDECHYASTPFDDPYCVTIEVGNLLDLELDCASIEITPSNPGWEGDDLNLSVDVCNVGTLPATNVNVQMVIQRGSFQVVESASFEGATNQPDGVMKRYTNFWDYPTEYTTNPDTGRTYMHYTTYDASDGNTAIANYHETGAQPWINPGPIPGFASDFVRGPILGTVGELRNAGMTATFDIKANLGATTDRFMFGLICTDEDDPANLGYGVYYSRYGIQWFDWTEYTLDISNLADVMISTYDYPTTSDVALVIRLNKAAPGVGDPTCPWNSQWKGFMLDNIQITSLIAEEDVIYQQTNVIPSIPIEDCVNTYFNWDDIGVGQYVITTTILNDDEDTGNNECITTYNVINVIECMEDPVCVDYTGPGQGHWVEESCCGGYFWAGDSATTMYGNSWDDSLYMLDPVDKDITFNLSAYTTVCVEFDTWFQLSGNDKGYLEVSMDGGLTFWPMKTYTGNSIDDPAADDEGWIHVQWCDGKSDKMQFRFRFISNASGVNRGWFIDNIEITGDTTTIFGPDPALTFTNFYRHQTQFGCWWQQPWIEKYAFDLGCLDTVLPYYNDSWVYHNGYWGDDDGVGFEPSWGVYDPYLWVPGTYNVYNARPWNGAYPDNLNTALVWTLDVPVAFYGWFETMIYYDMANANDKGYVEISTDNGVTWDELASYNGDSAPGWSLGGKLRRDTLFWVPGIFSLGDYLDVEQIKIQFRFTSDAANTARMGGFGMFYDVCFYGMNDNNAPVTKAQMTGTFDEECHWYTSCVKIKLDATDDITGVAHTYYTLDGVQYEYTQLVSICTDGTHEFCYWSVDNEGNVEEKQCLPEFRIDMTGPTVDITGPSPGLYLFGNKIMEPKSGKTIFLFNGIPVTATATASDNPVEVVQFFLDDVLMAEDSTAPYSATLSAKHTGPATIKVVAIDGQGRTATDTLNIDNYFKLF